MPVLIRRCAWAAAGLAAVLACLSVFGLSAPASAAEEPAPRTPSPQGTLTLLGSPKVMHIDSDPDHVDWSWLVGLEWQRPDSRWHFGFSYFNNSFGQKCQFYYTGYTWKLGENYPNWYLKLSGGLIYGYKEPYEDKVPFNHNGYSPGIFPALGYKWNRWNVQFVTLGTAAVMFTVGYDVIR
jgi:hypothetical protein